MWKGAVVAYYTNICLDVLSKISVGLTGLHAEIWTLDLPNMKHECLFLHL
jgi:hypothetical protein